MLDFFDRIGEWFREREDWIMGKGLRLAAYAAFTVAAVCLLRMLGIF